MTKNTFFMLYFIFILFAANSFSCPYSDSIWETLSPAKQTKLLEKPIYKNLNDTCFIYFLNVFTKKFSPQKKNRFLFTHLKNYCSASNSFTHQILHAFVKCLSNKEKHFLSAKIKVLWEQYNNQIHISVRDLKTQGQLVEADNLFLDMDALSLLDNTLYPDWAEIKWILGDYGGAAKLYCAMTRNIGYGRSLFKQLLIDNHSPKIQKEAISAYKNCYKNKAGINRKELFQWLRRMSIYLKLYDEEINNILEFGNNTKYKGYELHNIAKYRYSRGLYAQVIFPATLAWEYSTRKDSRQQLARLLFDSYSIMGKLDSAGIWLERSNNKDPIDELKSITFYQNTKSFNKADSLIKLFEISSPNSSRLNSNIIKDTLIFRQFLLQMNIADAHSIINKATLKTHWKDAHFDRNLWRIRASVFSGTLSKTREYIDSLKFYSPPATWKYYEEILSFKMALQRLASSPKAFKTWCSMKYFKYCNKSLNSFLSINPKQFDNTTQLFLFGTLIEELIEKHDYSNAQKCINQIPNLLNTSQISYYQGVVYSMLHKQKRAKSIFEEIILTYPNDVFAHKARMYLITK